MAQDQHGRLWRMGEYLGVVTDEPKPKVGSAAWWGTLTLSVTCGLIGAFLADRLGWL